MCQRVKFETRISLRRCSARGSVLRYGSLLISFVLASFCMFAVPVQAQDERTHPTPRPRPTPRLRPTPSPAPTPTVTPTATPMATATPTPTGTPIPGVPTLVQHVAIWMEARQVLLRAPQARSRLHKRET